MKRVKYWLWEGSKVGLIAMMMVLVADRVLSPALPEHIGQTQVRLLSGKNTTLATLSEKHPLLIYVWASWCGICKLTTPAISTMAKNGAQVLAVALQSGDDVRVQQWMAKKNMTMPGVNDSEGMLAHRWKITATPVFIILYKGKVVSSTRGLTSRWGLQWRLWWAKM